MRSTRVPGLVLAGAVGLAGVGAGVVIGPAAASAATSSATKAVGSRVTAIKDALAGLVKDGTITQAQADKVATTLDKNLPGPDRRAHGMRFGAGLDEAASIIGVSESDLRSQLQSGKTLAQIAGSKGMSQTTLVDKLVAAAKSQLAAAVKSGRLTQKQADAIGADLRTRITRLVTSTGPMGHRGHDGGRGFGGPGPWSDGPGGGDGSGGTGASSTPSGWSPASA
ncbi:MAG TPA: hypothetical protein VFL94_03265 [Actinomycetales bacterium]|nr:hypothetical protein [Actinomycetales bacterium]